MITVLAFIAGIAVGAIFAAGLTGPATPSSLAQERSAAGSEPDWETGE